MFWLRLQLVAQPVSGRVLLQSSSCASALISPKGYSRSDVSAIVENWDMKEPDIEGKGAG